MYTYNRLVKISSSAENVIFESTLRTDVQGLLGLYEASHLNAGENMLDQADEFSSKHLKSCIKNSEPNVARLVRHNLNPSMPHDYIEVKCQALS